MINICCAIYITMSKFYKKMGEKCIYIFLLETLQYYKRILLLGARQH